jgi:hypothetical protein
VSLHVQIIGMLRPIAKPVSKYTPPRTFSGSRRLPRGQEDCGGLGTSPRRSASTFKRLKMALHLRFLQVTLPPTHYGAIIASGERGRQARTLERALSAGSHGNGLDLLNGNPNLNAKAEAAGCE